MTPYLLIESFLGMQKALGLISSIHKPINPLPKPVVTYGQLLSTSKLYTATFFTFPGMNFTVKRFYFVHSSVSQSALHQNLRVCSRCTYVDSIYPRHLDSKNSKLCLPYLSYSLHITHVTYDKICGYGKWGSHL